MNSVIFWDVDTQNDFMLASGKLYVPGAEEITQNLACLTEYALDKGIPIVASVDDHRLEDEEIALKNPDFRNTYPPHCLHGTPGQEKIPATRPRDPMEIENRPYSPGEIEERVTRHHGEIVIKKQKFDVFTNPNTDRVLAALDPSNVVVYGVALDVCDRFAVEGLLARGRKVHLVLDATRAIRPEEGGKLVQDWRSRGVGIATTSEVLEGACPA